MYSWFDNFENEQAECFGPAAAHILVVDGTGSYGGPVFKVPGPPDLEGLLLSYHRIGHLLHDLWHHHGNVRLFCSHETGTCKLWTVFTPLVLSFVMCKNIKVCICTSYTFKFAASVYVFCVYYSAFSVSHRNFSGYDCIFFVTS